MMAGSTTLLFLCTYALRIKKIQLSENQPLHVN